MRRCIANSVPNLLSSDSAKMIFVRLPKCHLPICLKKSYLCHSIFNAQTPVPTYKSHVTQAPCRPSVRPPLPVAAATKPGGTGCVAVYRQAAGGGAPQLLRWNRGQQVPRQCQWRLAGQLRHFSPRQHPRRLHHPPRDGRACCRFHDFRTAIPIYYRHPFGVASSFHEKRGRLLRLLDGAACQSVREDNTAKPKVSKMMFFASEKKYFEHIDCIIKSVSLHAFLKWNAEACFVDAKFVCNYLISRTVLK